MPDGFIHRFGVGEFLERLAEVLAKFLVAFRTARETDDGEVIRQETVLGEVIEGRDDFAVGEVTGRAEDDRAVGGTFVGALEIIGGQAGRGRGGHGGVVSRYFSLRLQAL